MISKLYRLVWPLHYRIKYMNDRDIYSQIALDTSALSLERKEANIDPWVRYTLLYLPVRSGDLINHLDVGAGAGRYFELISACHHFANEPVDDLWYKLVKKYPGTTRVLGNSYKLSTLENSYDVVTCFHTLHHLVAREKAFREFYRVLKSGGYLVMVEPKHTYRRVLRLIYNYFTDYIWTDGKKENIYRYATHDFCMDKEITSLCDKTNFDIQFHPWNLERVLLVARKS